MNSLEEDDLHPDIKDDDPNKPTIDTQFDRSVIEDFFNHPVWLEIDLTMRMRRNQIISKLTFNEELPLSSFNILQGGLRELTYFRSLKRIFLEDCKNAKTF